jgi:TPR repeat protein
MISTASADPPGEGIDRRDPVVDQLFAGIDAFHRRDYVAAMRIFRPLAEQGVPMAQFYLGYMYDEGWGVRRSAAQSAIWFRKAAEQGDEVSQLSLGAKYFIGDGVSQSYAEATKWWLKASAQGNSAAQSGLGGIYEMGYGVPQNYILAYMWYTVSAHDPDHAAVVKDHLDAISQHMAPSQIAEAERLARQCLETRYKACPHQK